MAAFGRLRRDAVGLAAAGIVIGTAFAVFEVALLPAVLVVATVIAILGRPGAAFAACLMLALIAYPMRVHGRAYAWDPLGDARDAVLAPLLRSMPGDAGALAAGLALGDARYFTPGFRDAMKESSTTHLVALSGFNVALLLGFARRLMRGRVRPAVSALAGAGLLIVLLLLAGFQPSLVRASIAGALLLGAELAGRRAGPARSLLLIAALMLAISPGMATHLGFLLSFTASWALLATVGDMEALLVAGRSGLRATLAAGFLPSAVAQLGVAPVLLSAFGSVMLVGLMANPLVIPATPFLTALAASQIAVAHAAPALASVTGSLVALAMTPVLLAIRAASYAPLAIPFALPASVAATIYAAWFAVILKRKPALW